MYQIYADGEPLYTPSDLSKKELKIFKGALTKKINTASSFTFALYPSHPFYNQLHRLKTNIMLMQNDKELFRGRVLDEEERWDGLKTVLCEGELAFLTDSVVRPYSWGDTESSHHVGQGGVYSYLSYLLYQHNEQVIENRQIILGDVTVTDPNDYIIRASSEYPNTFTELKSKLLDLLGGYLFLRRENNHTYLDYLEEPPNISNQQVRIGINLLDLKRAIKGTSLASAIIPLGAKVQDENGEDLGRLDISSTTDGNIDYLFDAQAVEKYGWVFKTEVCDDVTTTEGLHFRGSKALAKSIRQIGSLELSAVDLSILEHNIDSFELLEYVHVISDPHGIDLQLLVEELFVDILEPQNSKLVLG